MPKTDTDPRALVADLTENLRESLDLGGDAEDVIKTVRMWLDEVDLVRPDVVRHQNADGTQGVNHPRNETCDWCPKGAPAQG